MTLAMALQGDALMVVRSCNAGDDACRHAFAFPYDNTKASSKQTHNRMNVMAMGFFSMQGVPFAFGMNGMFFFSSFETKALAIVDGEQELLLELLLRGVVRQENLIETSVGGWQPTVQ
jgi:hypothetical protein